MNARERGTAVLYRSKRFVVVCIPPRDDDDAGNARWLVLDTEGVHDDIPCDSREEAYGTARMLNETYAI